MRTLIVVVLVGAALAWPTAAGAATVPLLPEPGETFDTTETAEFTVQRAPDDLRWVLVLAAGNGGQGGTAGFMFHPEDGTDVDWNEVEIGWLAAKFAKLGQYSWWICDYDEDAQTATEGTCTAPRPFFVKFRLTTMHRADALSEASDVFKGLAGEALEPDVRCRRVSRTRQSCRVSGWAGDTSVYGRITVWRKRPPNVRTYDLVRYSAKLRIYNEYCHLVNKRPRSECDRPYTSRSGWTYKLRPA